MTESEWLACDDAEKMLIFLTSSELSFPRSRTDRLYACACCRQAPGLTSDPRLLEVVSIGERYAEDEEDDWEELTVGFDTALALIDEWGKAGKPEQALAAAFAGVTCQDSSEMPYLAFLYLIDVTDESNRSAMRLWGLQAARCVWGLLPFRDAYFDPSFIDPTVQSLAQAAYEERILPTGQIDEERLAVLSDALEEAGCTDEAILSHLRSPGPHVRGCWALDLILGKE